MKNNRKSILTFTCAVLLLSFALRAEETCPVEVKLLLSPPTIQTAIASFSFKKETATRVYFFDSDALDLLKQGVIVRIRQGADNDLTVKVRVPEGNERVETAQLRGLFPCEIDRTGGGENTSYSVVRKYKTLQVPETGNDIFTLLSPLQTRLLREVRASTDWSRVVQIANIKSTKWVAASQSTFRKLALELWVWPAGSILEISAKVSPDAGPAKYSELQRLVNTKGLSLSAKQGTKTRAVLETLTGRGK